MISKYTPSTTGYHSKPRPTRAIIFSTVLFAFKIASEFKTISIANEINSTDKFKWSDERTGYDPLIVRINNENTTNKPNVAMLTTLSWSQPILPSVYEKTNKTIATMAIDTKSEIYERLFIYFTALP